MKFILGKKIGMSEIFDKEGKVVPVSLVLAGPCFITQIKTKEKDGYTSVQIGFEEAKKLAKPQAAHLKKIKPLKNLREFRLPKEEKMKVGQEIDVSQFQVGEKVKVEGISKAKGFAGVMKRHDFKGAPATHGHKHDHRAPGSIGVSFPEYVPKGRRMAGRMGGKRATVRNLTVVSVDKEKNILTLKGAVPGKIGGLLKISAE